MVRKFIISFLAGVAAHQLRPLTDSLGYHTGDLARYVIGATLIWLCGIIFANDEAERRRWSELWALSATAGGLGVALTTWVHHGSNNP